MTEIERLSSWAYLYNNYENDYDWFDLKCFNMTKYYDKY